MSKDTEALSNIFRDCKTITVTQLDLFYQVFQIHKAKLKNESFDDLPETVQKIIGCTGYWFSCILDQLGTEEDIKNADEMYKGSGLMVNHEAEIYERAREILLAREEN